MTTGQRLPADALEFVRRCVRERKIHWTYHVNMRLAGRYISRDEVWRQRADCDSLSAQPRGLGSRSQDEEGAQMKCRVCGSTLRPSITNLPFKVSDRTIVILKDLPVSQCEVCSEYLMTDPVFAKVEELLSGVDTSIELEIIPFAA